MYLFFIVSLFREQRIYWYFLIYQKQTPQNQLDQKKSEY